MKVLLINPAPPEARAGRRRYRRAWPPLDLLTSAAALREHGHATEIIDARAAQVPLSHMAAAAAQADMVVLTTAPLDRWQCPDLDWRAMLEPAAVLPLDRLVVMGTHAAVRPELVLEASGAANVVRCEPEDVLVSLAEKGPGAVGVSGTSRRGPSGIVHEPDAPPVKLDGLPAPAYDLIRAHNYGYELLGRRLGLIETSRGCPYACSFCLKALYGPGVRYKALDRALAETEMLVNDWGADNIYYIDLEFTLHRERTMTFCEKLTGLRKGPTWCCQTRVDAVDPEMLRTMKRAGCRLIHFGVESGADHILEQTNKKITLDPGAAGRGLVPGSGHRNGLLLSGRAARGNRCRPPGHCCHGQTSEPHVCFVSCCRAVPGHNPGPAFRFGR